MKAPDLAHAFVMLDRFFFYRLQETAKFQNLCVRLKQQLEDNAALVDFQTLCEAGAEGDELLWLLKGCEGLPGFSDTFEVFGWPAAELTKGLATIQKAARVIEKTKRHPFGLLTRHVGRAADLDKDLRSYGQLVREARSDFGHQSQWFLNIAKARLVTHVLHRTNQDPYDMNADPHDKEVSGLIAAMTGTAYIASAQRQWRRKYGELIRDNSLDPYTVMDRAGREKQRQLWNELATREPEFFRGYEKWIDTHEALERSRNRK